jgi:hypothetical protein
MKPVNKQKNKISLSVLKRLRDIFIQKKWEIQTEEDSTFDDFCDMLEFLNPQQRDCVLDLTQNFLRVDVGKYLHHIRRGLNNISSDVTNGVSTVYILPLLPKEDYGKSKSSTFLTYFLRGRETKTAQILSVKSVFVLDRVEDIMPYRNSPNWFLLLVDDFIGTGETAEQAIADFRNATGIGLGKLAVFSLIAQKLGYDKLTSQGIKVFYSELRNRGITDEYVDPKRSEYLEIMSTIDDMLKVKYEYRLGYGQSEALVTLNRTPNNTFPVFWRETNVNGKKFVAPFPRR